MSLQKLKHSAAATAAGTRSVRPAAQALALLVAAHAGYSVAAAPVRDYPVKPIRWIVPFVAGGGVDVVARAVAQKLAANIGQPVVVDNRAGAAGAIGAELAATSPPDGYTLLSLSSTLVVNQAIHTRLAYDLTRDFSPVTQMTAQPYFLTVHASVPARTVTELIELAKAKPDTLNYASSGTGGLQHLAGALLSTMAGIRMVHVPYKGGGAAHNDLVAGHMQVEVTLPLTTYSFVKSGRLRYLAVTSLQRMPAFADIPAVAETLPGYDVTSWYGVTAPAKTPPAIVALLSTQIVNIMKLPDVGGRFAADGTMPEALGSAHMGERIVRDLARWREVAQKSGIRIE